LAGVVLITFALGGCASRPDEAPTAFDPDSVPEAYRGSTAALLWPGATRAFQVRPDGDLYNGAWMVRFDAHGDGHDAQPPRVIAWEERWRPIARWARTSGRIRWTFEATALPAPDRGDSGLVVTLEARATNPTGEPLRASLAARLEPPYPGPPFVVSDEEPANGELRWGLEGDRGAVHAMAFPADVGSFEGLSFTLEPGATRAIRFVLPAHPTEARTLGSWSRTPHARRVAEARRHWNDLVAAGARFELGDPEVERAVDAARVLLLGCREPRGTHQVPIGAPLHYRDVWLRDGARAVAALAVAGHVREARALAGGLALLQWPNGAFLSQRGQPDGTGQALWAFDQTLLRGERASAAELAPFADASLRAWRWIEWQREIGRGTGWRFGHLLPFGEPRDNELVRAQLVGSDAWAIAGYRAAVRLLRAVGRGAEADSVAASSARYAGEFAAALAATGSADIPPSWQGVGRDWGNLAVGWPTMALPANDPRCVAVARRVWRTAGGAGLATYADSLHYYVGADLATWALLNGRRAEADSVLAAMLHWRSASGGAGEVFARDGSYGNNLPPHATSAAALVMLVRNMLVFDDGDRLLLTAGARDAWWRGSRARGAPTRWGTLDLEFRRDGDHAEWHWTPVPVVTALVLPPGMRARTPLDGSLTAGETPAIVIAAPGTKIARVALEPAGGARP
jgi:hypothetical protein